MALSSIHQTLIPLITGVDPAALSPTLLPFVADIPQGEETQRAFWQVTPSGRYHNDCLIGTSYALETLAYLSQSTDPSLLPRVVMAMPKFDQATGIEIGYLDTLSRYAVMGAKAQVK